MPVESMRLLDSYSTYRAAISLSCKLIKQCQPFADDIIGGDKMKFCSLKSLYCELHDFVQDIESNGAAFAKAEDASGAVSHEDVVPGATTTTETEANAAKNPSPIPGPSSLSNSKKCFSKVSLITFDDESSKETPAPTQMAPEVDKIFDLDSLYEASKSATGSVVRANADNMYCLRVSPSNPFAVALSGNEEEHVIQL